MGMGQWEGNKGKNETQVYTYIIDDHVWQKYVEYTVISK